MNYLSRVLRWLGVLIFGGRTVARHARGRHLAAQPHDRLRRLYTCCQPPAEWSSLLRPALHRAAAPRIARLYQAVGGTASAIRPYVLSPSERRSLLGWETR